MENGSGPLAVAFMADRVREKVAALSEAVVLADGGDLRALAALHLEFRELGESWRGDFAADIIAACQRAESALDTAAAGSPGELSGAMRVVSECAGWLQAVICDDRDPRELPALGGLSDIGSAAAEASSSGHAWEEKDVLDPDPSLLADFVRESLEHLENSDVLLMALESGPADGESVNGIFRAFHTIKGVAGFLGFQGIQAFAHGTENLLDMARQGSLALDARILDVAFAAVDVLRRRIQWVAAHGGAAAPDDLIGAMRSTLERVEAAAQGKPDIAGQEAPVLLPAEPGMRLGEILVAAGKISAETVDRALRSQGQSGEGMPLGEALVRRAGVPAKEVGLALASQKKALESAATGALKETVKVEAARLDRLLDAIGELVIAESMVLGAPELKRSLSPALVQKIGQLDKITRELQEMGTSLRMVPIRPIFQKMQRLVRDLSKQSGKAVDFVAEGEETELDKTVVEKIGDPLVHMLRNSLDHGIESDPDARERAGKPRTAKVRFSAFQKGGSVCIEIADDGRGLDRDAILAKARERGLWREETAPSDKEIFGFIFEAGFSTAKQVTELSGRGVGMDVVKRNIESLRGRIDIQSRPGQGTTFSIWLPLTLAIIDGMVVRVGKERFIIPTLSIVRIVTPAAEAIHTFQDKGEMLRLQDELIPVYPMRGYLCGDDSKERRLFVVTESEGRKAAFPVDELLDQQQIVIKKLEEEFPPIPGISGGAILADGRVGLILDVDTLMKSEFQP